LIAANERVGKTKGIAVHPARGGGHPGRGVAQFLGRWHPTPNAVLGPDGGREPRENHQCLVAVTVAKVGHRSGRPGVQPVW
jgi:hypothetical protein